MSRAGRLKSPNANTDFFQFVSNDLPASDAFTGRASLWLYVERNRRISEGETSLKNQIDNARSSCVIRGLSLLLLVSSGALANTGTTGDRSLKTDVPAVIYHGCEFSQTESHAAQSPSERIRTRQSDVIKQRQFVSFTLDDLVGNELDTRALPCWFRIDGVWQEEMVISLDKSKNSDLWQSDEPDLLTLTNGNYTTPEFLIIEDLGNEGNTIAIRNALNDAPATVMVDQSRTDLQSVLTRGGPRKVYTVKGQSNSAIDSLVIGTTRTGRIRINYAGKTYVRPVPASGVNASEDEKLRSDDVFLLGYNLKNLKANRQGYDVVTQDAFRLLDSDKLEVFDKVDPTRYGISEQQVVPLGLKLVQEFTQGTVYAKELISSETQFQETTSFSFGASVDVGRSSGTSRSNSSQTRSSNSGRSVSSSIGLNYSQEQTKNMYSAKSEMQALGFARSKRYAMVVDHPYVTLSKPFIEAVDDARASGNYEEIIRKFGTHYAYAVTYGSVGKLTQRLTSKTVSEQMAKSSNFSADVIVSISKYENSLRNSSNTEENENWSFVALGGNGSWDQSGFATGDTPYPILLDLRPLSELLNPMNFPGEDDVNVEGKFRLQSAIENYMSQYENLLNSRSVLPKPALGPGPRRLVKRLTFQNGGISYYLTKNSVKSNVMRFCLVNNTGQPKTMSWNQVQGGVNNLSAERNGDRSCANLELKQRVKFTFNDRGYSKYSSAMNLHNFGGALVEFYWVKDY